MKPQRTICLILALLMATPAQADPKLLLKTALASYVVMFAGMLVGGNAEYVTRECLIESAMIPYDAPDYNQRKEALLQKYKDQKETLELSGKIGLVGFTGFLGSIVLMFVSMIK